MSIYGYEQAFGAYDVTSQAMRNAIDRWYAMYYDGASDADRDPCQRIAYTVVNKLVKSVFGEYRASAETPFGEMLLAQLDEKKRTALQLALVGGACYLKPCLMEAGFSFTLVPRNRVLVFGRDKDGRIMDMGLMEKSVEGSWYYTLLERRTVDAQGYLTIRNRLFRSRTAQNLGAEVPLKNVPAYSYLAECYCFPQPIGSVGLRRNRLCKRCAHYPAGGIGV